MSNIVVYDVSGRFRLVSAPDDMMTIQCQPGEAFLIGTGNILTDYVNQGEIVARPAQSTAVDKTAIQANGVDAITITGAPIDAVFTARNLTTGEAVTGPISGSDTFTSEIAGTFLLTITRWPYIDWTATVEAQ